MAEHWDVVDQLQLLTRMGFLEWSVGSTWVE